MDEDDISADIGSAITTLSGGNNDNASLPALRRQEEQFGEREERLPARTVEQRAPARQRSEESLPANRQQVEEDDELDENAEEQTSQRQVSERPAARNDLDKPPVAWRGPLKEKWTGLDPDVKREIQRREKEIAQTLSRTDQQRQYAEAIYNEIAPYEAQIRSEGSNHIQAVRHLFQMANVMRTGPLQQKAELIAELFFRHEVPIALVDQVLVRRLQGQPAPADPIRAALQQELAPVREFMNTVQQTRQRQTQDIARKTEETYQQLLDDPDIGDFVDELRDDIADLLDLATKRGQVLNLRDAAVRATMAHPEFGPIYNQRQLAKQAQQSSEKANKARRAGASLSSDGAPSASEEDDADDGSIEATIRSSIKELSRRQR